MGSRWTYYIKCAKCGTTNDVYYAPSSGFDSLDFTCSKCKVKNKVVERLDVSIEEPFEKWWE